MMLRYSFEMEHAATLIEGAVRDVLAEGLRTADIFQPGLQMVGTREMGEAVIAAVNRRAV